jgi:hypothetical protein
MLQSRASPCRWSDRLLSVARIATPSALGSYATSAMIVVAPNTLLRTRAFCASCMLTPPRTALAELPCTSLFSIAPRPRHRQRRAGVGEVP